MNRIQKTCATALASTLMLAAVINPANACATREDELALQAANVQQRLMVAALTCHAVKAYNRFVITYRKDLQDSDAALMAFFQKSSNGTAAYHTYKTRLANLSALSSVRNDDFCHDASMTFHAVLGDDRATLRQALAELPQTDTGFDACSRREARDDREDRQDREDRSSRSREADVAMDAEPPEERDWRW